MTFVMTDGTSSFTIFFDTFEDMKAIIAIGASKNPMGKAMEYARKRSENYGHLYPVSLSHTR